MRNFKINQTLLTVIGLLFVAAAMVVTNHLVHSSAVTVCAGAFLQASDLRLAYANAYKSLWKKATNDGKNLNPGWMPNQGNKILSQSDLITEILLSPNKTNYQFGINTNQLQNGQPVYNTERRLNLQDTFFVSQIGYFYRMVATSGGNLDFSSQLYTHVPSWFFGAVDQNWSDNLWNGTLSLAINNRTVVPEWDLYRHREVPQTQYPTWGTYSGTALYPANDEQYGSTSGMYPCEPMWILDGSYDNVMNIAFNNPLTNSATNPFLPIVGTNQIHMVVVMRGILAQNCGKIMEPGLMNPA